MAHLERCERAKKQPFLDLQPLTGPPSCTWKDFCRPRLRQFDPSAKIKWKERVSHGIDGIVWKAEINGREYAVKVAGRAEHGFQQGWLNILVAVFYGPLLADSTRLLRALDKLCQSGAAMVTDNDTFKIDQHVSLEVQQHLSDQEVALWK
ncbi:hypothetical protein CMUS01_11175 [Colletotrichum musicola]|uniref:Uncharacterized protein n=1 Tax=Colletotrichum musicola TaxID=2175873 RepID=A0A8H6K0K7_9PEZI|nr:hypothetical protein CMUS01_11175 [Colletotrichum musicola]